MNQTHKLEEGEVLSPEALLEFPLFTGLSKGFLSKNSGAVVRRHFKKGDIICREGEYRYTAFFILEGTVDVFINTQISHVETRSERKGSWFRKMTSFLHSREPDSEASSKHQQYIRIDAPLDLSYHNPIAQMGEGELFGEMSCLNFYPRSATVRAAEDCTLFEMLRNVLDQILKRNKEFKAQLTDNYRERALDKHLHSVSIFKDLPFDFIDYLRNRVELVRFDAGDLICKQGDPADAFYLIRIGHVKVTKTYPGGDITLAYLGRGEYFGEIGLLRGENRMATCSAADSMEAVRIAKEDFDLILKRFPEIRQELEKVVQSREQSGAQTVQTQQMVPLDDFLTQGLMEAQNLLILNLNKCTRCDECVRACADAHDGVTRLIREGLRFDKYLVATSCRQCRDPLCMIGCPVGSITRNDSLEILIEDWCIGCGLCVNQCPYDNINLHEFEVWETDPENGQKAKVKHKKATVCDLCCDHTEPACVYACPHNAAQRVDPRDFFELGPEGSLRDSSSA